MKKKKVSQKEVFLPLRRVNQIMTLKSLQERASGNYFKICALVHSQGQSKGNNGH